MNLTDDNFSLKIVSIIVSFSVFTVIMLAGSLQSPQLFANYVNKVYGSTSHLVYKFINNDKQVELPAVSESGTVVGASSSPRVDRNIDLSFISMLGYKFDRFFELKQSPLYGTGEDFSASCGRYSISDDNCTTLIAISYAETNYCKAPYAAEKFNCWGWGGAGKNRRQFKDFAQAIDTVAYGLKTYYGDAFLRNPRIAANTYCGGGEGCDKWPAAVELAKRDIRNFLSNFN